jgi:hypothetical protein
MQSTKSQRNTQPPFTEIPGELDADRAVRYALWKKSGTLRTESERIAAAHGLDPDAHLTRRELKAKRRAARQSHSWKLPPMAGTPLIEQNGMGAIVKVELVRRGE